MSPIDVTSADEIGQVARAFDQVHAEAVRLAGNEALLRRSFNAMFVSLSRRSQSLIQVSDSGVGISEARLAEMNQRLDDPPAIDESVSRHMGLFAVARLAERHGVRVRLRAGNPQGLTALVWLPDSLAERVTGQYGDVPQRLAAFQARRAPGQHAATSSAADSRAVSAQPDAFAPAMRTGAGTSDTARAASPATSDWFRSRQPSTTGTGEAHSRPPEAVPQPGGAWRSVTDGWAGGRQAAQIITNPVRGDRTVAGMPVRVPHANLLPGSADGGQRAASRPADGHEGQTLAMLPQRTPETTRSRLSGFQRGGRRAEGQTPHAGERTDR